MFTQGAQGSLFAKPGEAGTKPQGELFGKKDGANPFPLGETGGKSASFFTQEAPKINGIVPQNAAGVFGGIMFDNSAKFGGDKAPEIKPVSGFGAQTQAADFTKPNLGGGQKPQGVLFGETKGGSS